ncbi:MAG: hypothetical protein ABR521_09235 [Gaiellaceae bacterium]
MTLHPRKADLQREILSVVENDPDDQSERWYCCPFDGGCFEFETPEEGVAWGLARAPAVIVRTKLGTSYWAGERPAQEERVELRPWPPAAEERARIDAAYEAAAEKARGEAAGHELYERERERWLAEHAPELVGAELAHETRISLPDGEDEWLRFEELVFGGALCGGRREGTSAPAFGSEEHVLTETSGLGSDHPWVAAVRAALARERAWKGFFGRRWELEVRLGTEPMYHVTPSVNRDSIAAHGLDWQRMASEPGIAGSMEPELAAVFLCESLDAASFFVWMASRTVDIWEVDVTGRWLESGPDGWYMLPEPVPRDRIRLVQRDLPGG